MGPVALLRGANRPLLTKLVESEVRIETADEPRDRLEIDFRDYDVGSHCIAAAFRGQIIICRLALRVSMAGRKIMS